MAETADTASGRAGALVVPLLVALIASCSEPAAPVVTPTSSATVTAAATPMTRAKRSPAPPPAVTQADVVLRLEQVSDIPVEHVEVVIMADGRYASRRSDGTVMERRLSASGVQRVRDEVSGTGLFARDQSYGLEPGPGKTIPVNRGYTATAFKVWNGTRTVRVSTMLVPAGEESLVQSSAARDKLVRLAQRLRDLETWLPVSAWSDAAAQPYAPQGYRIFTVPRARRATDVGLPAVDTIWPFTTPPLDFGSPLATPVEGATRCEAIASDDEAWLREALAGGGAGLVTSHDHRWYTTLDAGTRGMIEVYGRPLWPDDEASCAGVWFTGSYSQVDPAGPESRTL